jgi:hypothetical protein
LAYLFDLSGLSRFSQAISSFYLGNALSVIINIFHLAESRLSWLILASVMLSSVLPCWTIATFLAGMLILFYDRQAMNYISDFWGERADGGHVPILSACASCIQTSL